MADNASMTCCNGAPCDSSTNGAARRGNSRGTTFRPAVDVLDGADAYRIVADLPGSSAEGVRITFEEGVLTLDAEVPRRTGEGAEVLRREYGVGPFHRRFRVAGEVDADSISASYASGVLTVTLPKSARSQRRRVPVSTD